MRKHWLKAFFGLLILLLLIPIILLKLLVLFQYLKNLYQRDIKFTSVILGFSNLNDDLKYVTIMDWTLSPQNSYVKTLPPNVMVF